MSVNLSGVANAQTITVRLSEVIDSFGETLPPIDLEASLLIGDVNANGAVNASDVAQAKGQIGQPVNANNFRADVNVNGSINASDVATIKANIGTGVP
jgi:hypothetical protein